MAGSRKQKGFAVLSSVDLFMELPPLHPRGGLYKSTYGVGNRRAILGCLGSPVVWRGPGPEFSWERS